MFFKILASLLAVQEACDTAERYMKWDIEVAPGRDPQLVVRIDVIEADQQMVSDMREMFAPRQDIPWTPPTHPGSDPARRS